jgi:site-specific DNA-methyltransferase (adenine-specific)
MVNSNDVLNRIHLGRAEQVLEDVPADTVHLTVTSPPYWDLKRYEDSELGTLEDFMAQQKAVFEQVYRVTVDGGFLACNVGTKASMERHIHLPFMFLEMLTGVGFHFQREHIWMRPKGSHGVWQRGTTAFMEHHPHPKTVMTNIQHEYVFIMQRPGKPVVDESVRLSPGYIKDTCWSVWPIRPAYTPGNEHPAPFPEELVDRLVVLYSNEGEVVLDPFAGSGTTPAVAKGRGRMWVGIECEDKYVEFARERVHNSNGDGLRDPYQHTDWDQGSFDME